MDDTRPDPEQLLARLKTEAAEPSRRGRLKVFFGFAAGVGKTYAMLEAARAAAAEGADIVLGYIEPHARPETAALTLGLDMLPARKVEYRGVVLRDSTRPWHGSPGSCWWMSWHTRTHPVRDTPSAGRTSTSCSRRASTSGPRSTSSTSKA